jgi:hypothetical protein
VRELSSRPCGVVERVIVGLRDAIDAQTCQRLGNGRRRLEEERLARIGSACPALGDTAFEVAHEQVRPRVTSTISSVTSGSVPVTRIASVTLRRASLAGERKRHDLAVTVGWIARGALDDGATRPEAIGKGGIGALATGSECIGDPGLPFAARPRGDPTRARR